MLTDHAGLNPRLVKIREISDRAPRPLVIGASLLLLSLAVWVDWRPLGSRIAFPLYYLIPIGVLAWFAGWLPALAATIASAIFSFVGLTLAGPAPGKPLVFLSARILTFGLTFACARVSAIGRLMLTSFLLGDRFRARIVPIRIGPRLASAPTREPHPWKSDFAPEDGNVDLLIRPGISFGSGSHETTQMCLTLLEDHIEPGQRIFDFGSGSGILSIAAARLGATKVVAVDIDPRAEQAIHENIELNQVGDIVRFRRGSWPVFLEPPSNEPRWQDHSTVPGLPYGDVPKADLLVANILTYVVIEALEEGLTQCVRPGGKLILSGIRLDEWDEIRKALDKAGLTIVERRQVKKWLAVVAMKPDGTALTQAAAPVATPRHVSETDD